MTIYFGKWNPGTGKPWVVVGSEIDDVAASLTVEEARQAALEIINRAWKSATVSGLIEQIRKQDA